MKIIIDIDNALYENILNSKCIRSGNEQLDDLLKSIKHGEVLMEEHYKILRNPCERYCHNERNEEE